MVTSPVVTTVIVPAYNEESGLPIVLTKIFHAIDGTFEVLVLDDGSTDRTAQEATKFPCRLIRHATNRGKGAAIATGVHAAQGRNIICIDADDTYPAELIPEIAQHLEHYDMVVGSRLKGRNHIPWFNRIGNWIFRSAIRVFYRFPATDPLTGLWGIRRDCALLLLPEARHAPDAEMAMKAGKLRLRVLDLPVTYRPRIGESKLPPVRAGYEHFRLIITLLLWSPSRRPHPCAIHPCAIMETSKTSEITESELRLSNPASGDVAVAALDLSGLHENRKLKGDRACRMFWRKQ